MPWFKYQPHCQEEEDAEEEEAKSVAPDVETAAVDGDAMDDAEEEATSVAPDAETAAVDASKRGVGTDATVVVAQAVWFQWGYGVPDFPET